MRAAVTWDDRAVPSATPTPPSAVALAEVLPVGVLLAGDDGSVRYANPALLEIFEAPAPATLADLSADEPFRAAATLWRAADNLRQRCTLPDGRVLEGTWHRLAAGRCLTVTDATSDALIRRRLRQHNRALAELVATKTELVSALLHEVRTPLTAARTMASLLPDAPDDPVMGALERNLGRLEEVTREIATISAIENRTLDLRTQSVDLDRLLGEVAARLDPPVPFVPSGGSIAAADPALLAEVFERLITAVRAIGGGDGVTAGAADGQWRLSLPLPPDAPTDRLFTATGEHGNATALMFARAVIGRHDGSVGIEHEHLTVRLPLLLSPDRSSVLPPGSAGPAA
jgi:signal transduction histidine kinase